jgi:hypothetical protein
MWTFDFHGSPQDNYVILDNGKNTSFQLCATAEVVKTINKFPGAGIVVTINWVRDGTNVNYQSWQGEKPTLPLKTILQGPFPDGRYCAQTIWVKHSDFPQSGSWHMKAEIAESSVGFLLARWEVKKPPHKPAIGPNQGTYQAAPSAAGLPTDSGRAAGSQRRALPPPPAESSRQR